MTGVPPPLPPHIRALFEVQVAGTFLPSDKFAPHTFSEHPDQTSPMTVVGPEIFEECADITDIFPVYGIKDGVVYGEDCQTPVAQRYTCLDDELSALLDLLSSDPTFPGFTCFRDREGQWMVSLPQGSRSVWNVNHYDSISDGLSELYARWKGC